MKIKTGKRPWPHFIVTNFISDEMYSAAKQIHERMTGEPEAGKRNTFPFKRRVNHYLYDELETNFLSLLSQVGLQHADGEVVIEFDALGAGFEYHPHTDIATKIASFVYHVSEQGTGTRLLTREKNPSIKTLPWIVNGGGGFVRTENSWHTFDNVDFSTVRRTMLLTLRKQA